MVNKSEGSQSFPYDIPSWMTEPAKHSKWTLEGHRAIDARVNKAQKEALKNRTETTVIKEVLSQSHSIHPVNQKEFAQTLIKAVEDFNQPKSLVGKLWNVIKGIWTSTPTPSAQLDRLIAKVQHLILTDSQFMKSPISSAKRGATAHVIAKHGEKGAHNIETVANRMISGLASLKADHELSLQGRVQPNPPKENYDYIFNQTIPHQ